MQAAVFDNGNKIKSFGKFSQDAQAITDVTQKTWLRVEYETCRRNAVQADRWLAMDADKDLYPFWVWRGRMDARERPDHVEMEGQIFRIGDPYGDRCFPPGDWNCRCSGEPLDDNDLRKDKQQFAVNSPQESEGLLNKFIDKDFRYNAAISGPMPSTGSYTQVMSSANNGQYKNFGLPLYPGKE